MALVVATIPTYSIEEDDNFDAYVDRLIGYLNAIGVNPRAGGGPPTGRDRTMGIIRAGLKGSAADFFDENIVGKNWKLSSLLTTGPVANINGLRALRIPPGGAGGGALNANSLVPGSSAYIYATDPANNAVTVQQAFIPLFDMRAGDAEWEMVGAEPTTDAPNAVNAGNNRPIVLQGIWPNQALSYMRTKLPPMLNEKRKLHLNNMFQDNDPVKVYWKRIERAGKLLKLPQPVIEDYFYRGLSPDNIAEVERMDPDLSASKVLTILEKIEKRRSATRLGLSHRDAQKEIKRDVTATEVPPLAPQEPTELRQIAPKAIAQEHIDKLLNRQADQITQKFQEQIQAFQSQFQALQDKLSQQSVQQQNRPPIPIKSTRNMQEFYESHNPFDDDYDRRYTMDEIMGESSRPNKKTMRIANTIAQAMARREQEKMDRQITNMTRALAKANLDDDDPMDTSNIVYLCDEVGDEYTANLTRGTIKKK